MHPLSEELQEVRFGKRARPGTYAGWPGWEQRAADALDAYHEGEQRTIPEGCKLMECEECGGNGTTLCPSCQGLRCEDCAMTQRVSCPDCLGTGKRLRKEA